MTQYFCEKEYVALFFERLENVVTLQQQEEKKDLYLENLLELLTMGEEGLEKNHPRTLILKFCAEYKNTLTKGTVLINMLLELWECHDILE